jgi:hypothetical protein
LWVDRTDDMAGHDAFAAGQLDTFGGSVGCDEHPCHRRVDANRSAVCPHTSRHRSREAARAAHWSRRFLIEIGAAHRQHSSGAALRQRQHGPRGQVGHQRLDLLALELLLDELFGRCHEHPQQRAKRSAAFGNVHEHLANSPQARMGRMVLQIGPNGQPEISEQHI